MKLSDQITRRHLFVAFGTSQQTGSLSSVDLAATRDDITVTLSASDGSVAPIAAADSGSAGVMTAADKLKLDRLPPARIRDFSTSLEISGTEVDTAITHLRTAGHAGGGDGGSALFKRVASEPAHGFKARSADGSWWEGVPGKDGVSVHQFGALGDGLTDDTPAIQSALDYARLKGREVWFHKGKIYKVGNLTVTEMRSLVMRSTAGMGTQNEIGSCVLKFHGAANSTLLLLKGVLQATVEGISFQYGSAAPDAYIKTNYSTGWGTTSIDLDKVLFDGNGKSDGSVGFDVGPDAVQNNADFNWGRVEFRNIQTGVQFNHLQQVAFNFEYIRAVGCGTAINIADGGGLKIGTLNCSDNDIDVKARGGGGSIGTLTIDNAHVEQSSASATAVFLDAASTGSLGWHVVLNNPIVTQNYTGHFIKIGQACHVVCNGGFLSTAGTIDLAGTEDDGDAVFVMVGGRFGGTWTTNDWGYYRHIAPMVAPAGGASPFGGTIVLRNGKALGHDEEKMPAAQKRFLAMPIHRPGGSTVTRALPPGAVVTGINLAVESVGSATGSDKVTVYVGGVAAGTIVVGSAGPRHLGWRVHDLDAADGAGAALGAPEVISALKTTRTVQCIISAGSASNIRTTAGQIYVEYVVKSVMATGLDP